MSRTFVIDVNLLNVPLVTLRALIFPSTKITKVHQEAHHHGLQDTYPHQSKDYNKIDG